MDVSHPLKPGGITPVLTEAEARAIEESQAKKSRQLSTAELKARAEKAKRKPSVRVAQASAYVRDAAVAEYVKRLANGCATSAKSRRHVRTSKTMPISNVIISPG
jgi:hypothetical protein